MWNWLNNFTKQGRFASDPGNISNHVIVCTTYLRKDSGKKMQTTEEGFTIDILCGSGVRHNKELLYEHGTLFLWRAQPHTRWSPYNTFVLNVKSKRRRCTCLYRSKEFFPQLHVATTQQVYCTLYNNMCISVCMCISSFNPAQTNR